MIKSRKILLIDDDENDNFIHQRAIRKAGSGDEVVIVTDGVLAMEYITGQLEKEGSGGSPPIDVIFLDINMPRMDGFEFLQEYGMLKDSRKSKTIIIMLSTSASPKDMEKALCFEYVVEYIYKPLTVEKFREIINKYFPNP